MNDLDDGGEAVGGAARIRDDVVFRCVVLIVVDAEDDSDVFVARRSGDDDLLDGAAEVGLRFFCIGEEAGGFDDDLGADGSPVELGWVALCEDLDLLAVYGDKVRAVGDLLLEVTEDGVIFEEVGQGGGGGEVVDGDEFDVWVAEGGTEDVASNAAEAVNAYLYWCHDDRLLLSCSAGVFLRVLTPESAAKSLTPTNPDATTGKQVAQIERSTACTCRLLGTCPEATNARRC